MKSYKELEREAYITGNTELANVYAAADNSTDTENLEDEVERLRNIIDEAANALAYT